MQVNEHARQARPGKRLPAIARPKARAERPGAEESRRPVTRVPTRWPPRYGAGF